MVSSEKNTYFSSILSQKKDWTIEEIIDLTNNLLTPFSSLDFSSLEPSDDVLMLRMISKLLPYKLRLYATIVSQLMDEGKMECPEFSVNVFNADTIVDSIALIYSLVVRGYKIDRIKSVRIFGTKGKVLSRTILLYNCLFSGLNVTGYDLGLADIKKEAVCDSLLTINLFPNTFSISENDHKQISSLIKKQHLLYSHTIFVETELMSPFIKGVSHDDNCSLYWRDLNKLRFNKYSCKSFNYRKYDKNLGGAIASHWCLFSTTSLMDLSYAQEYKIVLPNLCPGTPCNKVFNSGQNMLFFDTVLKDSGLCEDFDDKEIVTSETDFITGEENQYTLKRLVEDFPQYIIVEGLKRKEYWAQIVFDWYLLSGENGHPECYNNLGVLACLYNCLSDDFMNPDSDVCKTIINFWTMAANYDNLDAIRNLSNFYISRNMYAEGVKYYELAYNAKDASAAYSLGVAYEFGLFGCSMDTDKAISMYKDCLKFNEESRDTDCQLYINQCTLNLILLLYRKGVHFSEIERFYSKIQNPSETLKYAYAVMLNNKYNGALEDFFKILKLNCSLENEPSYVQFNQIVAQYNGVKIGSNKIQSDKKNAYDRLKNLANTGCKDWKDYEKYVWPLLARWSYDLNEPAIISNTYWIKATEVNPERACAYGMNTTLKLGNDEAKEIIKKYIHGNGCSDCHECGDYNKEEKCCPKAQVEWALRYEDNHQLSQLLIKSAANQGYLEALEYIAIYDVIENVMPKITLSALDKFALNIGIFPEKFQYCIAYFAEENNYKNLCAAAETGSKKAIAILTRASSLVNSKFEYIYWMLRSASMVDRFNIIKEISDKNLSGDFFYGKTLTDTDLIAAYKIIAEQFIGTPDDAYTTLKELAEFYVRGEKFQEALNLYKIAQEKYEEKRDEINTRMDEIEALRLDYEERQSNVYYENDDYDNDYYDDYDMRDTWDAMTDGMYGDMPEGFDGDFDFLGY
jgi:hypothetical protein